MFIAIMCERCTKKFIDIARSKRRLCQTCGGAQYINKRYHANQERELIKIAVGSLKPLL